MELQPQEGRAEYEGNAEPDQDLCLVAPPSCQLAKAGTEATGQQQYGFDEDVR